jgi:hypothetical protein
VFFRTSSKNAPQPIFKALYRFSCPRTDHVNEQPPSYWTAKFRERGFEHARAQSHAGANPWKAAGDVESWLDENLILFRRTPEN